MLRWKTKTAIILLEGPSFTGPIALLNDANFK